MPNLYNNVRIEHLLNPINSTSTRTSTHVDTLGFYEPILVAHVGFAVDTLSGSVYWTAKLQHGDTTGAFTDVTDADTTNGAASYVINSGSLDERPYVFKYKGTKRYLRVVITATGSHSSGTPLGVTSILAKPAVAPVV